MITNLIIGGIKISVEKKQIKNLYIRIIPPEGNVQITAPMSTAEDTIRMFAASRIEWIKKHREKIADRVKQRARRYITGESYYLWGNQYYLDVIYSNARNNVSINGQKIILQVHRTTTFAQRAKLMENWYRKILKKVIPPLFQKCEKIVGVRAKEWKVKNMKTKWGTCNVRAKRIWLNLQLVKKTPECLEYVIIHELVHFLEKSHNSIFKAYMDRFYPNWRAVKAYMNKHTFDHI